MTQAAAEIEGGVSHRPRGERKLGNVMALAAAAWRNDGRKAGDKRRISRNVKA
jgi:hypothetical protein